MYAHLGRDVINQSQTVPVELSAGGGGADRRHVSTTGVPSWNKSASETHISSKHGDLRVQ